MKKVFRKERVLATVMDAAAGQVGRHSECTVAQRLDDEGDE